MAYATKASPSSAPARLSAPKHIRTQPFAPKTNGKAECLIQTSSRKWAYARAYPTSEHRKQAIALWMPIATDIDRNAA
jgi:hypothetical protein